MKVSIDHKHKNILEINIGERGSRTEAICMITHMLYLQSVSKKNWDLCYQFVWHILVFMKEVKKTSPSIPIK